MNYQEVIQYLYNATPVFEHIGAAAYKPGLQTTEALDAHYGHPHEHYRTIHVAGTNGKGSVSHSLASILQEAGLRVGLYTSPHLVDFRERIRVNGECISEDYVIRFVEDFIRWNSADEQAPEHKDVLYPSFFELTTALAFKYFADANVDVAVVEVGLGGRLDCTNIIRPELCVITNIALDHTQFLGSTLAEIASEKAGIIKPGVPVVIGETTPETKPVFEKKAQETHAPIFYAEDFTWPAPLPDFELKGSYQTRNLQTILCAANQLEGNRKAQRRRHCLRHSSSALARLPKHGADGPLADTPRAATRRLRYRSQPCRLAIPCSANHVAALPAVAHRLRNGRRQGHRHRSRHVAQACQLLFYAGIHTPGHSCRARCRTGSPPSAQRQHLSHRCASLPGRCRRCPS